MLDTLPSEVPVARYSAARRRSSVYRFALVHGGWLEHLYLHPSYFNAAIGSQPTWSAFQRDGTWLGIGGALCRLGGGSVRP